MSYHRRDEPSPIVPLRVLAQVYMFAPGHPRVPRGAAYVRVARRDNGVLVLDWYDRQKRPIERTKAKWTQTAPIAPPQKTQVWWTRTAYWGPTITPESEVGPVPMARPPTLGILLR